MPVIPTRGAIRPLGQEQASFGGLTAAAEGFASFGRAIENSFGALAEQHFDALASTNLAKAEREFRTQALSISQEELLTAQKDEADLDGKKFEGRVVARLSEAEKRMTERFSGAREDVLAEARKRMGSLSLAAAAQAAEQGFGMQVEKIAAGYDADMADAVKGSTTFGGISGVQG